MNKGDWITLAIIFGIIIFATIILNESGPETPEEIVKCIGARSTLYIQLGCHACETQEDIFRESYKYLNVVDCFYETKKCGGIEATPTWIIDKQKYRGVQSIEELQKLTGCN